ncbi:hypothetical protein [Spongiimicrobium sp. 2-473A-2-J]|uniref:hypothetical protein n=1 Tax=Eudoraea algarum TaxID=3417568 RepID=UPI003D36ED72
MDYYNINELEPIDKSQIKTLYKKSKASEGGSILVWGDCIGRPGDNIYRLLQIEEFDEGMYLFNFSKSDIILKEPNKVYINEFIIAVECCNEIIWHDRSSGLKIRYSFNPSSKSLIANVLKGSHNPVISINEPAFMLAW